MLKHSLKALFKPRFNRWLNKRMPAQKEITLNNKNTFIFPSKFGIKFLMLCFVLFLLGTNYQNNLILFVAFFLCSFMVTCLLLSFKNMSQLSFVANPTMAQFAGQDCVFCLRMNKKDSNGQQINFHFQEQQSALYSLIDEQQVFIYSLAKQRGYFNPGRVTISSTFPFGLFRVWTHLDFGLSVLLYPEPINNGKALIRSSVDQSNISDSVVNSITGFDEFAMLKNYQPGESLKSVAWKQLAQGRGWFSKQFEQAEAGDILLDIDLYPELMLEEKLSLLCFQILELDEKQRSYALNIGKQRIASNSGLQHKQDCLKALALYGSGS